MDKFVDERINGGYDLKGSKADTTVSGPKWKWGKNPEGYVLPLAVPGEQLPSRSAGFEEAVEAPRLDIVPPERTTTTVTENEKNETEEISVPISVQTVDRVILEGLEETVRIERTQQFMPVAMKQDLLRRAGNFEASKLYKGYKQEYGNMSIAASTETEGDLLMKLAAIRELMGERTDPATPAASRRKGEASDASASHIVREKLEEGVRLGDTGDSSREILGPKLHMAVGKRTFQRTRRAEVLGSIESFSNSRMEAGVRQLRPVPVGLSSFYADQIIAHT
ncbi:Uu.00g071040.m01.CDS01 [Anthostomella pinea]|uniref:Uu.00g071040.m01.CDS01 n=1 Tax=Anthostomella pinea TaxID=933095 RepID=A0AAI8YNL4_9PEZI|nr:Uu.00g071040.m01.CDS01 [Anthostomella pinea]